MSLRHQIVITERVERQPTECKSCGSARIWQSWQSTDGSTKRKAKCFECHRKSGAAGRAKHGGAAARNKVWESRNLEKNRAHKKVENAIVTGALTKRPCERCGSPNVHAHHDDYSKPLDVM